jgi:hypothetical protein
MHPRQIRARAIGETFYQLRARHRWCHEHAKRRAVLAVDCIRVGPYLGTPLANTRSLSSFVILCVVTFAIMASAYLQQAHSQE